MKAVLISLLISLTPNIAQAQDQRIIKMGQIAPFSGVLVSSDIYRKIYADATSMEALQQALDEKKSDYILLSSYSDRESKYMLIGGIVLGIFIGYYAGKQ